MSVLSRAAAALTGTVLVVLTLSVPAHADVLRHRDHRHDLIWFDGQQHSARPRATNPDITRVTIRHGAHQVSVRVAAREVTRRTDLAVVRIVTPEGRYWVSVFLDEDYVMVMQHDQEVTCPRATASRFVRRDLVTITVPRRCLDNPRWVKVGGGVIKTGPGGTAEKGYLDVMFGGRHAGEGEKVLLSRRVASN